MLILRKLELLLNIDIDWLLDLMTCSPLRYHCLPTALYIVIKPGRAYVITSNTTWNCPVNIDLAAFVPSPYILCIIGSSGSQPNLHNYRTGVTTAFVYAGNLRLQLLCTDTHENLFLFDWYRTPIEVWQLELWAMLDIRR